MSRSGGVEPGHTLSDRRGGSRRSSDPALVPCLVVAMECERPLRAPAWHSLAAVDEVIVARSAERSCDRFSQRGRRVLRLGVPSRWMSSLHARLYRSEAGWVVEDTGSKNGTFLAGRAVQTAALGDAALIEAGRTLFWFRDQIEPPGKADDLDLEASLGQPFATSSNALHRVLQRLERIAGSDVPVLILGETGTGKELAARALHQASGRSGRFVGVNCGALPESILESELFGHRKGAFSGALEDHPGLVRSADGGTLFLDEIAELPPGSQVALLRVLQEREVRPVGGSSTVNVDIRVVAATLQELPARVAGGRFREDLYARLAGLVIELPPLRDRREDLGLLCAVLLGREAGQRPLRIHVEAARALFAYHWPLNVRELEHALRAAVVLAEDDEILLEHLPAPVQAALAGAAPQVVPAASLQVAPAEPPREPTRDQILRRQLEQLLREHRGNVSAVARELGKAPAQIYRWLKRLGIAVADYR